MAESESRFEVLEEETHYPATHPKSTEKQESQPEESLEEKEEETLEQQLERLVLSVKKNDDEDDAKDNTENVKKASGAKELGNKFFSRGSYLDAIECYTTALKLCPADE
ncbi:Mitochondrial Protein Translocase (MPT) Family [Phytophthora palmivora]|nr:Mitochondrial Protein Translocase (MPT) Family [Phytophthora palmivora]